MGGRRRPYHRLCRNLSRVCRQTVKGLREWAILTSPTTREIGRDHGLLTHLHMAQGMAGLTGGHVIGNAARSGTNGSIDDTGPNAVKSARLAIPGVCSRT